MVREKYFNQVNESIESMGWNTKAINSTGISIIMEASSDKNERSFSVVFREKKIAKVIISVKFAGELVGQHTEIEVLQFINKFNCEHYDEEVRASLQNSEINIIKTCSCSMESNYAEIALDTFKSTLELCDQIEKELAADRDRTS